MYKHTEKETPEVIGHYRIYSDPEAKIIVAVSRYAGKTVRGVAKCHPNDEFDIEFGTKLAIARCEFKVANKRADRAYKKVNEAQMDRLKAEIHLRDMLDYLDGANQDLKIASELLEELEQK